MRNVNHGTGGTFAVARFCAFGRVLHGSRQKQKQESLEKISSPHLVARGIRHRCTAAFVGGAEDFVNFMTQATPAVSEGLIQHSYSFLRIFNGAQEGVSQEDLQRLVALCFSEIRDCLQSLLRLMATCFARHNQHTLCTAQIRQHVPSSWQQDADGRPHPYGGDLTCAVDCSKRQEGFDGTY